MTANRKEVRSDGDAGLAPASERRCAVTRQILERDRLLRFVRSPDEEIVPDLECRLPGRGVWVGAHRSLVDKAVSTNAFAKSLKMKVRAPADLGERIDAMMARRLMDTLSMANKAGLAVSGFEKVSAALDKQRVAAILHGCDGAADGRSKLDRKFNAISASRGLSAPVVDILTIEQLGLALGRGSVVHAALIPGGLSDRFLEEAVRLKRYRSLPVEPVDNSPEYVTEG